MGRLIDALGLVPAAPRWPPEVEAIMGRMADGGYKTLTITVMGNLYSARFFKEGEEEIHVTGQSDIAQVFKAALAEAHRRYRAGVLVRDGAHAVRTQRDGDGDRGVVPEL